jgi:tetratricopeptide (TPR) repeat protein
MNMDTINPRSLKPSGGGTERDAAYYHQRAQVRFRYHDFDGGFADLDEAIRLDPTNPEFYWSRALCRYQRAVWDSSIPMDIETILSRQQRNLELAEADFARMIALSSDAEQQAEAYRKRLSCHRYLGQFENAITDANWLIEHGFGDGTTYEWRGICRRKLGHLEEAIHDLTIAVQSLPDYYPRYERARAYYQARQYRQAIQDLTEILSSHDVHQHDLGLMYQWRAFAYYRLGEFENSFHDFNQVQQLHGQPPFPDVASYVQSIQNLEAYESNPEHGAELDW